MTLDIDYLFIYQNYVTENQKEIGQPISVDEFHALPIKRKQKYMKKLYLKIGDAE